MQITNISNTVLAAQAFKDSNNLPISTVQYSQPTQKTYSTEEPSSVVSISPQAQLANLGSNYDVSNMTEKEMGLMSRQLFDSGLIGSLEFSVMSFPLGEMRTNMGLDTDASQKIDYLLQYTVGLDMAKKNNATPQELKTWENIVTILDELNKE